MGFWSSLGDALNAVVGVAISVVLTPLLIANPWLISVVALVALGLGLLEKGTPEEVEELGNKALQCDKTPDDFDNFDQYFDYVKNFEVDPEKSKTFSPEDKKIAGAELTVLAIEEKNGIKVAEFFKTVAENKDHFTPGKIESYIKTFSEAGVDLDKVHANDMGKIEKQSERDKIDNLVKKAEEL
ncbi:MAG: hypothetical protein AB7V07_08540 [Candidatus Delongbacteria bacterium]